MATCSWLARCERPARPGCAKGSEICEEHYRGRDVEESGRREGFRAGVEAAAVHAQRYIDALLAGTWGTGPRLVEGIRALQDPKAPPPENCPECTGWRGAHGLTCSLRKVGPA